MMPAVVGYIFMPGSDLLGENNRVSLRPLVFQVIYAWARANTSPDSIPGPKKLDHQVDNDGLIRSTSASIMVLNRVRW